MRRLRLIGGNGHVYVIRWSGDENNELAGRVLRELGDVQPDPEDAILEALLRAVYGEENETPGASDVAYDPARRGVGGA